MTLLIAYVSLALIVSFSCSILEATLLSARTAELLDRKSRGDRRAALLLELKQARAEEAIGAILTLNTIAHTVGSTLAGAPGRGGLRGRVGRRLLRSADLPRPGGDRDRAQDTGTVYASRLSSVAAVTIEILIRVQRPLLAVIGLLTHWLLPRKSRPRVSRGQIAALAASAARDGALSTVASRTVESVLGLEDRRLRDVVVPRNVATIRPESTTVADFLNDEDARGFARIPLYSDVLDDASSYVLHRDVLATAVDGGDLESPLSELARPAILLPDTLPVERALERLTQGCEQLALVFDEHGSLAGLVTVEDLVEAALGLEIVDETDRVSDLRAEALRRHRERLRRDRGG